MIIKGSTALEKGIRSEFVKEYASGPSAVPLLATIIQSNKDSENYAWLGEVPSMREFVDQRLIKGFSDTKYTLANKTFEGTLGVHRNEISDDETGGITIRTRDLARRAAQHPDQLLWEVVELGDDTTLGKGYDNYAFFGTAHPVRGAQTAAQSNKLTGTGTTVAAFKTDVQAAIAAMRKFKDEAGKPFHPMIQSSDLVVAVAPDLEFVAKEALNASIISNTSNALQGAVSQVMVMPWLTDTNDWYLFNKGHVLKPFIFQDREPLEFTEQGLDSDTGFMKDVFLFGARARYNVGYGLWQCAVMTTNA